MFFLLPTFYTLMGCCTVVLMVLRSIISINADRSMFVKSIFSSIPFPYILYLNHHHFSLKWNSNCSNLKQEEYYIYFFYTVYCKQYTVYMLSGTQYIYKTHGRRLTVDTVDTVDILTLTGKGSEATAVKV